MVGVEVEEVQTEAEEVPDVAEDRHPPTTKMVPGCTGDPSTLTSQPATGQDARCIIAGGKELIFVLNPRPARGRTSSPPSRTSETGTSSAQKTKSILNK